MLDTTDAGGETDGKAVRSPMKDAAIKDAATKVKA